MPDGAAIGEPTMEIIAPDWTRRSARIDQTPFLIGRGSGNQLELSDGQAAGSRRGNDGMVGSCGLEPQPLL
jgi:hypothetical protein